jgi:hypothetical protein
MSFALPALLAAGVALRPPLPPAEEIPRRILLALPGGVHIEADPRELWAGAIDTPDPLVYWSPAPAGGAALPAGAVLLGSLATARRSALRLPASGGTLTLYSQATRSALADAPTPKEMP